VGCTHACALTDKGGAKCWWRNIYGQLGIGRTSPRENPVDVIVKIVENLRHSS